MTDGLLVGRFQPFHLGHLAALRFALDAADSVWVGIGSSNRPAGASNPFTAAERRDMILSSVDGPASERISIYEIPDVDNHMRWLELIERTVPPFGLVFTNDDLTQRLYRSRGDGIRVIRIPFLNRQALSGTRIRAMIRDGQDWQKLVPSGTLKVLARCDAASRLAEL